MIQDRLQSFPKGSQMDEEKKKFTNSIDGTLYTFNMIYSLSTDNASDNGIEQLSKWEVIKPKADQ